MKLVEKLKNMYLEKGGQYIYMSVTSYYYYYYYLLTFITLLVTLPVAYALHEMSLRSSDIIKNYLIDVVPLVFLAMHIVVNNEGTCMRIVLIVMFNCSLNYLYMYNVRCVSCFKIWPKYMYTCIHVHACKLILGYVSKTACTRTCTCTHVHVHMYMYVITKILLFIFTCRSQ